jgi:hypothetical protein
MPKTRRYVNLLTSRLTSSDAIMKTINREYVFIKVPSVFSYSTAIR